MIDAEVTDLTVCADEPQPTADRAEADVWVAFEAEALPHAPRLFRFAMWAERNRAEAEDAVQETLTQALQLFHRYQPGTNCRAWLLTILQHVLNNRRRARQRSPVVAAPDDRLMEAHPFVPPIPQRLTDEDLLGALGRLPQSAQDVIVLSDVEELSYKEIAATLAIPLGTVMSRLHRARALLRAELAAVASDRRAESVGHVPTPHGRRSTTGHDLS
jgi:RNA polymerase sigma-70 factor (ECF subfamily)